MLPFMNPLFVYFCPPLSDNPQHFWDSVQTDYSGASRS